MPIENPNRRDLCLSLAALAAMSSFRAQAETAPSLIHSEIFPYDKLPVTHSANGGEQRKVLHGTLATSEFVEVHETVLPPGQMPHPPHRHTHSEFLLIREGHLEVTSDGQKGIVDPGAVVFTASGVLHGLKNIGQTPASYFVVAVGIQKDLPV